MNITLEPKCLQWARERAGFSVAELADKLRIDEGKVNAWEQSGELSFSVAERLANATHTPLGYLFLPEPPVESLPIKDFRTVQTQNIAQPTVDLLDVVNDALRKQDWYREYIIASGGEQLEFVGSLEVSDDILGSAKRIRDRVVWTQEIRAQSPTWESALSRHIDAVEEIGILVMRSGIVGNNTHRPLSVSEFRGFALSDEYAPLIFINSKDAKAAQLFTLAHELVHIWLGISGVSNLNQTYSPDIEIERFCNAVSAELLVPIGELEAQWKANGNGINAVAVTARHFKVSSLVILRRLFDSGYIPRTEFQRLYNDELAQFSQRAPAGGGGDFYRTLRARLGKRFVSALVESTFEGGTPYREAFQLLGVNDSHTLSKLASLTEATA